MVYEPHRSVDDNIVFPCLTVRKMTTNTSNLSLHVGRDVKLYGNLSKESCRDYICSPWIEIRKRCFRGCYRHQQFLLHFVSIAFEFLTWATGWSVVFVLFEKNVWIEAKVSRMRTT